MLPYLFPSAWPGDVTAATYDYYEPLTTHDSSLSCVIHSILAARLGRDSEAWDFFSRALGIDLDGEAGGAAEAFTLPTATESGRPSSWALAGWSGRTKPWAAPSRGFGPGSRRTGSHWSSH
jgi:hypothetical protein